jgi:hypothetical protein
LVSFPTTHRRELSFPIKGTLALPLPGCQTRIRVVPDVAGNRIIAAAVGNNNLCHSKIGGQQSIECVLPFTLTEGRLKAMETSVLAQGAGSAPRTALLRGSAHCSEYALPDEVRNAFVPTFYSAKKLRSFTAAFPRRAFGKRDQRVAGPRRDRA